MPYLGDHHLNTALEKESTAANFVDGDDRNESGDDVDQSRDDGGHQGGVVAETEGLEQDGSVEHDDVDAGELLEGGDQQGHAQLRPVFAPQQGAPWVPDDLGVFAGRDEVVVLGFDVVGSADLPKHGHGLLVVATLDQRVGGIGEEEGADGDDDGWHGSEAQAQAPAPPALDLVGGIVHQVGDEDADGDHKLEGNVEHPAELRRSHLREVERNGLLRETARSEQNRFILSLIDRESLPGWRIQRRCPEGCDL
ncbi:hypothetical protein MUK42_26356 [Musa troglodytarum]|uniref:Uncharacterized protein n=1 Tax=Musa troglodytarum TaxID=320322 RepID=A0A9E7HHM8_9LILI|nr:hypothetical protein MUK42_26356 [Musa troglodytarum]